MSKIFDTMTETGTIRACENKLDMVAFSKAFFDNKPATPGAQNAGGKKEGDMKFNEFKQKVLGEIRDGDEYAVNKGGEYEDIHNSLAMRILHADTTKQLVDEYEQLRKEAEANNQEFPYLDSIPHGDL